MPFIMPLEKDRMLVLSSKYNIEQVYFADCMSFQPCILTEEIPQPKYLKPCISME